MFSNIYFDAKHSRIHIWEYDKQGNRNEVVEEYKPYAFVYDKNGTYKDLAGRACKRKEFSTWAIQKEFVEKYDTLEGDINPECRFVVDRYYNQDLLSYLPKLHMHIIDIEVDSTQGFPVFDNPQCVIYLISVYSTKTNKITTFGTQEYHGKLPINYIYCRTEEELLKSYFKFHKQDYPDIISGWNSETFDIPYIIQRAEFLLGEKFIEKYSPVHDLHIREKFGETVVDIGGITQLDYLVLYKDYNKIEQESYRLDYIGKKEKKINLGKIKYEGTIDEFRVRDWEGFVSYNVRDVFIVKRIHDLYDFVTLVQGQAYLNKVPLDRVSSAMKKMDGYLMSVLKPLKIVLPTTKKSEGGVIPGGYVKEVKSGYYAKGVTYDYRSLYPSIMFALNLSPETYIGKILLTTGNKQKVQADNLEWYPYLDLENIIDDDVYVLESDIYPLTDSKIYGSALKELIKKQKWLISANGLLFKSGWGFIPRVVKGLFDKRKEFKDMMLSEEKLFEQTKDSQHEDNKKRYDALQEAQKVMCNSAYGVLANKAFRLFNEDFAMAITLTGQKINKYTTEELNKFFTKNFKTKDVVIISDTDSFMIDLDCFIKKYNVTDDNFLKAFTLFDEKMITPYTEKLTEHFSHKLINNEKNWFFLKKEVVSNGIIIVEKKKYAMQMIEKEGVKYDKPKMKIMGMEIVRSSTPSFCREKIEEVVVMLINERDKNKIRDKLKEIKDDFVKSELSTISFPRSVSGLSEYGKEGFWYKEKTPIQVRASLNYNRWVKELGMENKYSFIRDADKIRFVYLKPSNKYKENIVAFFDEIPAEFGLEGWIDYDTQWDKSFMSPINKITESLGWGQIDLNQEPLDSFF